MVLVCVCGAFFLLLFFSFFFCQHKRRSGGGGGDVELQPAEVMGAWHLLTITWYMRGFTSVFSHSSCAGELVENNCSLVVTPSEEKVAAIPIRILFPLTGGRLEMSQRYFHHVALGSFIWKGLVVKGCSSWCSIVLGSFILKGLVVKGCSSWCSIVLGSFILKGFVVVGCRSSYSIVLGSFSLKGLVVKGCFSWYSIVLGSFILKGFVVKGCSSWCRVPLLSTLRVTWNMQLYTDKCIPQGERIACMASVITPPQGQPHNIFDPISGRWSLPREEPITAEKQALAYVNKLCNQPPLLSRDKRDCMCKHDKTDCMCKHDKTDCTCKHDRDVGLCVQTWQGGQTVQENPSISTPLGGFEKNIWLIILTHLLTLAWWAYKYFSSGIYQGGGGMFHLFLQGCVQGWLVHCRLA